MIDGRCLEANVIIDIFCKPWSMEGKVYPILLLQKLLDFPAIHCNS